jgi:Na+/melibiose symporter-like transporter
MLVPDIFFSLIIALLISLVFAKILVRKGPRKGFIWFFLTVFLGILAAGLWVKPYGTPLAGSNWFILLLVGVALALLIISTLSPRFPEVDRETQLDRKETIELLNGIEREKKIAGVAYVSLNVFFWLLIFLLLAAITGRYLH